PTCSRCSARPGSASRGSHTSSRRRSRARRPSSAAAVCPTARASRSGRSSRSCARLPAATSARRSPSSSAATTRRSSSRTARPELFDERPSWGGGKLNATSILLEPLSRSDAEALIGNLPGSDQLDDEVRVRIADAADGNPLFLEQMLALIAEEGGTGPVHVPPNIQALLAARLHRLEPEERALLERASIVGNEFWRDAVTELSPAEERAEVPARLQRLVRRELVRPSRSVFPGDDAFRFRHLLIRDAAYDSLPKDARGESHERFAAWIDARASGRERELDEAVGSPPG